jgi:hypothetical protein
MGKTAKKVADLAPTYTPTDRERQAAQRVLDRRARTAPAPKFKVAMAGDKVANISADHPEPTICHTLLAEIH